MISKRIRPKFQVGDILERFSRYYPSVSDYMLVVKIKFMPFGRNGRGIFRYVLKDLKYGDIADYNRHYIDIKGRYRRVA